MKMKDVCYVPGLTKNLLSISALEKKGFRVAFIDGEVLMWAKGETIKETIIIGKEENGFYKLKGHSEATMTHTIENPCELWHRRLAHINYKTLSYICKAVTGLSELEVDHEGVCNGCAQGKNIKNPFPKRDSKKKESYNSFIQMCVVQCHRPPLVGMYTMYHLLMIILVRPGCIF
jgi:hypothetical protein